MKNKKFMKYKNNEEFDDEEELVFEEGDVDNEEKEIPYLFENRL